MSRLHDIHKFGEILTLTVAITELRTAR